MIWLLLVFVWGVSHAVFRAIIKGRQIIVGLPLTLCCFLLGPLSVPLACMISGQPRN